MRRLSHLLLGSVAVVTGILAPASSLRAAPLRQETPALSLKAIGSYATGIFDQGASEIVAYDPDSQRLFSINAAATTVDILDLSDPSTPTLLDHIDATELGASANSVAVHDGLVAVAIEAEANDDAGIVAFYDPDGTLLNSVTVGVLPDMVTFSPDGMKVLTANEGEPSDDYTIDPLGTVSIIDLSDGVDGLVQDSVTTLDFSAYNDAELPPSVRVFGPDATVVQDFEPEYVAVSPDSSTAWVTLQENNGVAVIDLEAKEITQIIGLGTKNFDAPVATLETHTFENLPLLGTTEAGQDFVLGGFSGLAFEGIDEETGKLQFITHPDRGPNPEPVDTDGDGIAERPFALPDYTARWVRFELDPTTGVISITQQIPLLQADGTTISGLPNLIGEAGMAYADELPIDLYGKALESDPYGADLEGIVKADDGTYWMGDEYRPAIYHFDATGTLLARYVPEGSNESGADVGIEAIPAIFAQRRANRGFEAVAIDNGILYAFIQSPIDNPDNAKDSSSKASRLNRILAFDTATATPVGEYLYEIDGLPIDKIGDSVSLGNGEFLVVERDDAIGPQAQKFIYKISLDGATNLLDLDELPVGLERQNRLGLATLGIFPVQKKLYVDLSAVGYTTADKVEGLTVIDENTLAVINDNDFNVGASFDTATGMMEPREHPIEPVLGIIHLHPNGLDASDKDDMIYIQQWPIKAYYLPDAIASYTAADGEVYYVTANEGDTRDYDGFSEVKRMGGVVLDFADYPDALALQADEDLGRLLTSSTVGDVDGDGLVDQLYALGARSFTIWRSDGTIAFDSGSDIETITADISPENFNSNGGADDLDGRSDDKGPEPEAITLGVIGDRTYAFVGLERTGGVMVYDVTEPTNSTFVTYANNRDITLPADDPAAGDSGPESSAFIAAEDSPTGQPLLVVGNEVSGSITVYEIDVAE